MRKLSLSSRFVDTVMRGLPCVTYSVLHNGSRAEEFKPTQVVRQGGHISPYLFPLAAKGLSGLLKHAMRTNELVGIHVVTSAPRVNHLIFANDCLLFFKAFAHEATSFKNIVDVYCNTLHNGHS